MWWLRRTSLNLSLALPSVQEDHGVAELGGEDAQGKSCVHFPKQGHKPDITATSLEGSGQGTCKLPSAVTATW